MDKCDRLFLIFFFLYLIEISQKNEKEEDIHLSTWRTIKFL